MADGKGFGLVLKINLPPEEQYHSGHSLLVQGDTSAEIEERLGRIIEPPSGTETLSDNARDQARFILLRFIEFAQQGAVQASLAAPQASEAGGSGDEPTRTAVTASPASDDMASLALLKVVAKKTGTPLEELEGTTTEAAKALLASVKGGK